MSLLDELKGALRSAQAACDAIGPKPIGEPDQIRACARLVRQQGDDVATAAARIGSIPAATDWQAPGADQLAVHAGSASREAKAAARELHEIADHLDREWQRVRDEQERWTTARQGFERKMNEIRGAIGRIG